MGSYLTGESQGQISRTPYGDIFDEFFPYYLAMGMTYEQYWYGETGLRKAYREAYRIRMEQAQRITDVNNWYMGQYIMSALMAVPLLVNGFVPKGAETRQYPDKPFLEKAEEEKKTEARRKKEEDQSKTAMALFQAFTIRINKNIEKRLEREKLSGAGQ